MSKRSGGRSAMGVGITTVVTIMVAVLLTTFSVLTLVTAGADLKLSQKAVDSVRNYYAADGDAEQWFADLDAFLTSATTPTDADLSAAGYEPTFTDEGRRIVSREFPIDAIRILVVQVAIDTDGTIDILQWQSELKK